MMGDAADHMEHVHGCYTAEDVDDAAREERAASFARLAAHISTQERRRNGTYSWDGNGLACPSCGSQRLRTTDARPHMGTQRRRRECIGCRFRFYTAEFVSDIRGVPTEPGVLSDD